MESENSKILWDFTIQCDRKIEARRPNIVFIDKEEREVVIIYVAIDYFRKKYPEYANNWLVSQIIVRAETVNVTAHLVGCNTYLSYSGYNITETVKGLNPGVISKVG